MDSGEKIKINFFGSFEIEYGSNKLSIDSGRTKQLWLLLGYLVANRFNDVSQAKLSEVLWDDEVDNPANALKNLAYRLRNMLGEVGRTADREYILNKKGSYAWNNDLPCVVDTEEFENLISKANDPRADSERKIELLSGAIELYRGDFLSFSPYEEWVVPLSTYYRGRFFECVEKVCELMYDKRMYDEIDKICSKAIAIDPFEESVQNMKMKALVSAGKYQQALSHYDYVTALFYRELGVQPSEEMRDMRREMMKQINDVETDLSIIKEDLREQDGNDGNAFNCGYEVFKYIYRLEARSIERAGQTVFIGLLTLSESVKGTLSADIRGKCMDFLGKAVAQSLRRGDVYSRYSATQYVFMLPTLNMENSDIVIRRIKKTFNSLCRVKNVILEAKIMPVDPAM